MKINILTFILIVYVQSVFSAQRFKSDSHNLSVESYEEPKFHSSIRTRNIDLFTQLLPFEQDLNIRNSRGQTPLTLAIILSEMEMITALLDNGAQLDLTNKVDQDALKYVGHPVKKILKRYGQIGLFCLNFFKK